MIGKIPNVVAPGESGEIKLSNSPFVEVTEEDGIDVKMQYHLLKMANSESRCFLRIEVYEKLLEAQSLLPETLKLRILDAWRPYKLQEELYRTYSETIDRQLGIQALDEPSKKKIISKYVSEPIYDRMNAPVHTTGGAVDVTLINLEEQEIDMGTEFDAFSLETNTCFYENTYNDKLRYNRRILYNVMKRVGFTNLPSEWWHYDYGDAFWSYYSGKPILYEGCFDIEEVLNLGIKGQKKG